MPDRVPSRVRRQLAGELVRARDRAGFSARRLADALSKGGREISAATISRVDNAQLAAPPDRDLIDRWLDIVAAEADVRDRVLALAEAAYAEANRWSDLLAETVNLQGVVADREAASVSIDNFQPTFVPGLLQTPAYMRGLVPLLHLPELDADATVRGRVERQQVLYDTGRRFRFLLAEHVLSVPVGDARTMIGQRDRLIQVGQLDSVELRILPTSTAVAAAWHGFVLHTRADGGEYVTMELVHGTEQVHDAAGVASYRELWDRLWGAAVTGYAAVQLIHHGA